MGMTNGLLSPAYRNDGRALTALTSPQRAAWQRFFSALNCGELKRRIHTCCPQCQTQARHVIAEKDRYGDHVVTAICRGCGLVYTVNPFDETSNTAFYRDHYRALYTKSASKDEAVANAFAKAKTMAPASHRFIDFLGLGQGDTVVELGCGAGWNLAPLADVIPRCVGFDYDADMISNGRARGLELYDLNQTSVAEQVSDAALVIIREVLEHTYDPFEFLTEINAIQRPGGHVFLTVPPLDDLPFGYASGRLLGTLQNAHNFLFDRRTLGTYLDQAGFTPIYLRHDMRVLAQKTGTPRRRSTPIPGNYERNLRRLRLSENLLQWYWRALGKGARLLGAGPKTLVKAQSVHRRVLSRVRRREYAQARHTGF